MRMPLRRIIYKTEILTPIKCFRWRSHELLSLYQIQLFNIIRIKKEQIHATMLTIWSQFPKSQDHIMFVHLDAFIKTWCMALRQIFLINGLTWSEVSWPKSSRAIQGHWRLEVKRTSSIRKNKFFHSQCSVPLHTVHRVVAYHHSNRICERHIWSSKNENKNQWKLKIAFEFFFFLKLNFYLRKNFVKNVNLVWVVTDVIIANFIKVSTEEQIGEVNLKQNIKKVEQFE